MVVDLYQMTKNVDAARKKMKHNLTLSAWTKTDQCWHTKVFLGFKMFTDLFDWVSVDRCRTKDQNMVEMYREETQQ